MRAVFCIGRATPSAGTERERERERERVRRRKREIEIERYRERERDRDTERERKNEQEKKKEKAKERIVKKRKNTKRRGGYFFGPRKGGRGRGADAPHPLPPFRGPKKKRSCLSVDRAP